MFNANIMPVNPRFKSLVEHWGRPTALAIVAEGRKHHKRMTVDEFLSHCIACGGNWGAMLLTGIKELWPSVWELIPEDMGVFSFADLCDTMFFCGVDTSDGGVAPNAND